MTVPIAQYDLVDRSGSAAEVGVGSVFRGRGQL